jgi:hypothetical protein
VAVIGGGIEGIICGTVLRNDGHSVTVLEASSELAVDASTTNEQRQQSPPLHTMTHPDFPVDATTLDNGGLQSYYKDCADHFGLKNIKLNTKVVEMKEKNGGWLLTYETASTPQQSNEYFDYVVVADSHASDAHVYTPASPPCCYNRLFCQWLPPFVASVLVLAKWLQELWNQLSMGFDMLFATSPKDFVLGVPLKESMKQYAAALPTYLPTMHHHEFLPSLSSEHLSSSLYRGMISHDIPRVAFLSHHPQKNASTTTHAYLASIWLSTMLYEEMDISSHQELRGTSHYSNYFQYSDLLMKDLGLNPNRKGNILEEWLAEYTPKDYRGLLHQVQERRRIAQQEGWAVPLTPITI